LPQLRTANRDEIVTILRDSHGQWGAGLSCPAYVDLWLTLMNTPWARRAFRYLVWGDDDGSVLSSLKLYRPVVRLQGRAAPAAMIGALFTPRARRRRGHAGALLRAVLAELRAAGEGLAMLFSDIGTGYYDALGFRALPAEEAVGRLDRAVAPPDGWELRPLTAEDLPSVARAHDDECRTRPIAVLRDLEHWEFLIARAAGYFRGLDGSDLGGRYRVALHRGRFAGYLVSLEGEGGWVVREVGAPHADPRALAAILRAGADDARRAGHRRVQGWFPRDAAAWVPEWGLTHRPRGAAIPMVLPLAGIEDLSELDAPGASFFPYLDQF
jgi:hypothetical protein